MKFAIRSSKFFILPLLIVAVVSASDSENEEIVSDVRTCTTTLEQLKDANKLKPYVTASTWLPNTIDVTTISDVTKVKSTFAINEATARCRGDNVGKPIVTYESVTIGEMPQMNTSQAMQVLDTAVTAWNKGMGTWTSQYTTVQRMEAIHMVLDELKTTKRNEIIQVLQWEIGKNYIDAAAEFDRTISFAKQIMNHIITNPQYMGPNAFQNIQVDDSTSYHTYIKRSAVGIILMLAPYNYPLNECYAMLIPALLLGNVCIVKIPSVGGLAHLLTMEVFAKYLPHGTINFLSGSGAKVLPSLMSSGHIDGLALIGSSKSADQLIQYHEKPHRLKTFLQLGAKNIGIVLPDVLSGISTVTRSTTTIFDNAISESILGSLSYNGQRCTALKLFFVPKSTADIFIYELTKAVEALTIGLPWQNHTTSSNNKNSVDYSQITPLPNHGRVQYMKSLIDDAIKNGAKVMNKNGGMVIGGDSSTLMIPAIVYPVTPTMKLYTEEQFGPIIPITTYDKIDQVISYAKNSEFAQQISIFGQDPTYTTKIVDTLGSIIPKINFNSQCARSPDILPFAARRSSGIGVMSVTDILEEFSVPLVVSYQSNELNEQIAKELFHSSTFFGATTNEALTT